MEVTDIVLLTRDFNVVIQNELPLKLKYLGSFLIPQVIGTMSFKKTLCELWVTVRLMPLFVHEKLDLSCMKPTRISLQLADRLSKVYCRICRECADKDKATYHRYRVCWYGYTRRN